MFKISLRPVELNQQKDYKENITIFRIVSDNVILNRNSKCLW